MLLCVDVRVSRALMNKCLGVKIACYKDYFEVEAKLMD